MIDPLTVIGILVAASGLALGAAVGHYEERERQRTIMRRIGIKGGRDEGR
jgi:hypothetical protein